MDTIPAIPPLLQFALLAWSIAWKGLALWNAAKHSQRNWFIVILVINTVGILEIIYLFRFATKRMAPRDLLFWRAEKSQ
jgi:methionyl-tRNA synthetase